MSSLRITLLAHSNKYKECLEVATNCLELLDVNLNCNPNQEDVMESINRVMALVHQKEKNILTFPPPTGKPKMVLKILTELIVPSFYINPQRLFVIVSTQILETSLTNNCLAPETAGGFTAVGIALANTQNSEAAENFRKFAQDIVDKFNNPVYKGKVYFGCGTFLNWYSHHFSTCLRKFFCQ